MTILDKIIIAKKKEVALQKREIDIKTFAKTVLFDRTPLSLKTSLTAVGSTGIIAEYKRQSPSKGIINDHSSVEEVTKGYLAAKVAGQSILTDKDFFGGGNADVIEARKLNTTTPILRKDFIVDEYQIVEAKSIGADVILLIATCLTANELSQFSKVAGNLGLDILYEVHTQEDLDKIGDLDHKIIGINNRNLKTFEVDLEHSLQLASQIPDTAVKVSESGISNPEVVSDLKSKGFQGFLIGENFMKTQNPGQSCQDFIKQIK